MAITVSVINYKGGVGKTTSAFNLGIGLSFLVNARVLLIDLDPQCSLTTIGLKAFSRTLKKPMTLPKLDPESTINQVFREYLRETALGIPATISLDDVILRDFYAGETSRLPNVSLIPATMFDASDGYPKGLDDLEIEMAMQSGGRETRLRQLSFLPRFFTQTHLENQFDFILFDCPPANNLVTQNALVVSDYYVIPTVMDDMSANGIVHLHSLIHHSIFGNIQKEYRDIIERNDAVPYFQYFQSEPKLLMIFETLRKTGTQNTSTLMDVQRIFPQQLVNDVVIYHHVDTARATGRGTAVFSTNLEKDVYSPHVTYGNLVLKFLDKLNMSYDKGAASARINDWL